jgi:hypothetical protein
LIPITPDSYRDEFIQASLCLNVFIFFTQYLVGPPWGSLLRVIIIDGGFSGMALVRKLIAGLNASAMVEKANRYKSVGGIQKRFLK